MGKNGLTYKEGKDDEPNTMMPNHCRVGKGGGEEGRGKRVGRWKGYKLR